MRNKELFIVPDDGVVKPYDSFKNHIGFQNKENIGDSGLINELNNKRQIMRQRKPKKKIFLRFIHEEEGKL